MKVNFFILVFLISFLSTGYAQENIAIKGVVLSESDGLPLPGANVMLKNNGGNNGTVTSENGEFSMTVPVNSILVVSFIGYFQQEILITSDKNYRIFLKEQSIQMDEVVVVGYGTQKKSDLTGSIASVKGVDIVSTSIASLDQGIQGKAAGVVVTQTSGQPGAATTIRIRGTSSINGTNEPLYVIDGVPIISDAGAGSTGAVKGPQLNPLASLNPSDIESIEILKDASATAIYGARGANGVILVSTKQGQKGKSTISYDFYTGVQQVRKLMPMLTAKELAELANEAADNANVDRKIIFASPTNLGIGTNWQEEIFRIAPIQNHQLSISGGTEQGTYAISLNLFSQDGIIIGSKFTKGNLRINLANQVKKKIKVGASINMNRSVLNGVVTDDEGAIPSSVTSWALEFNPGLSVYDDNGDYIYENNTSKPAVGNPVADALETQQVNISNRLIGNTYLEWDIIDDLKFRSSLGGDAYFNTDKSFVPNYIKRAEASNGQAAVGTTNGYTWLVENTLNYSKKISDHSFNALIGHSLQAFDSEYLFAASSDFEDNRLGFNAIQAGSKKTLMLSGTTAWQMQSVISRFNYNYKEKYLVTATGRLDGSSKFGAGNKYGFFPSFSAAWRVTQEDFWNTSSKVSNLKFRAGYGQVGNEGIPPYSSLGLLEITEAYFGETEIAVGAGPSTLENENLKWETTEQINLGLDLGLFDNRISVTTDVYLKNTSDLLLNAPVPYVSGYRFAYTNVGNMQNKGFEISATTANLIGDFNWNTTLNFSINKNKITKLTGEDDLVGQNILGINGWTRLTEGESIGTFYGYLSDGIIQADEDLSSIPYFTDYSPKYGDRKYVDVYEDGVINELDKVILGNANPDFTYGITNTFLYKAFTLNVYIQGVYGNEIVNFNRFALESFDGNRNNSTAALERWTPDNPTNLYPRANATPRANTLSDIQVEDGSYLRLKDVTLAYSFPIKFSKRLQVSSLRMFVSVKNLVTLTSYSGYDPEVSRFANDNLSMGADYGSYPSTKLFTMGISLQL